MAALPDTGDWSAHHAKRECGAGVCFDLTLGGRPIIKKKIVALAALLTTLPAACDQNATKDNASMSKMSGDKDFAAIRDAYVIEFLKHNPVVNTYLGGAG